MTRTMAAMLTHTSDLRSSTTNDRARSINRFASTCDSSGCQSPMAQWTVANGNFHCRAVHRWPCCFAMLRRLIAKTASGNQLRSVSITEILGDFRGWVLASTSTRSQPSPSLIVDGIVRDIRSVCLEAVLNSCALLRDEATLGIIEDNSTIVLM